MDHLQPLPTKEPLLHAGGMTPDVLIYLLDDDANLLESLQGLLESVGHPVRAFDSAEAFLCFPKPNVPSCLILDLNLGQSSGLEVQEQLTVETAMPIIFLTGYGDIRTAVKAVKGGASEFLSKPVEEEVLLPLVNKAIEDARARWEEHELDRVARESYAKLTPRERQILTFIVRGFLNKQTAYELGISEITVRIHRVQIMRKMGADSLAELIRSAARIGIPKREGLPS